MANLLQIIKLADRLEAATLCARWSLALWGYRRPLVTLEEETEKFIYRAQRSQLPMTLLAMYDNEVGGTASLVEQEYPEDGVGPWLTSVITADHLRGRGIARELVSEIETQARLLGYRQLFLSAAVPEMYTKLGYILTGEKKTMSR